jgi:hypothetical protein
MEVRWNGKCNVKMIGGERCIIEKKGSFKHVTERVKQGNVERRSKGSLKIVT